LGEKVSVRPATNAQRAAPSAQTLPKRGPSNVLAQVLGSLSVRDGLTCRPERLDHLLSRFCALAPHRRPEPRYGVRAFGVAIFPTPNARK
jgi:hypothetical protein